MPLYSFIVALEHRDYYREKKPDWENISSKKIGFRVHVFCCVVVVLLTFAFLYVRDSLLKPSLPVSVPFQQSVPFPLQTKHYATYSEFCIANPPCDEQILKSNNEFLQNKEAYLSKKEPPVVRSIPAGYQGYIEVNGVKKEIYSPAVVSETYRYKDISNVKYLPVKINGIELNAMIDTGASVVSVGPAVIQKLGIKEFADRKIHNAATSRVWAYYFPCSVSLGSFEVSNIQCAYHPQALHDVLLGGSFLKNFNYSFNESENTVTFSLR